MLAASFNRHGHAIVDHRTWFICSDGDLMEGISHEAASIAGLPAASRSSSGSRTTTTSAWTGRPPWRSARTSTRASTAYGWRVLRVEDGNDVDAIDAALTEAAEPDGRPTLIACRTHIGYGAPHQAGHLERPRVAARARGGRRPPSATTAGPRTPTFLVPDEVAAWRAGDGRPRPADPAPSGTSGWRPTPPPTRRRPRSCAARGDGRLPDGLARRGAGVRGGREDRDARVGAGRR